MHLRVGEGGPRGVPNVADEEAPLGRRRQAQVANDLAARRRRRRVGGRPLRMGRGQGIVAGGDGRRKRAASVGDRHGRRLAAVPGDEGATDEAVVTVERVPSFLGMALLRFFIPGSYGVLL